MKKERHPSVGTSLLFRYYVLMRLLHFLKVDIGDVVIAVAG